jgi:hypothetical protein
MVFVIAACSQKKKSDDIIAEKIEQPKAQGPVRLQPYTDSRDVQWIGRTYHIAINRQPSDSLPMVKDEIGQQFVDNVISLEVSRGDGSVFYSHTFTKKDFDRYLDNDYRNTGILEGLVYDKMEGNHLFFAASVGHPQTDEYIPMVVTVSNLGDVGIKLDNLLDTTGEEREGDTADDEDE